MERVLELDADAGRREAVRRAPMLREDSRIPALHADVEARWLALAEAAEARRGWGPGRGEAWRRWAGLLRRSVRLGLDPRRLDPPGTRLAGLGRWTAVRGAAVLRTAAGVARAGAAQAREEAVHVRGPRDGRALPALVRRPRAVGARRRRGRRRAGRLAGMGAAPGAAHRGRRAARRGV